jgi:biopolymer transport protein ExbD
MSKIKLPSKPPRIDMTPMVDLFFLLLTFFMLTTSFKPQEAVQVDTPKSISDKLSPKDNVITVYVGKDNKVYFNVDNGSDSTTRIRKKVLMKVAEQYKVQFTKEQVRKFENLASFGMPVKDLPKWIDATEQKVRDAMQTGVPMDSLNNQLEMWILISRNENPNAETAIKGDYGADYKTVKKVMDLFQKYNMNKFNLTTTLEKVDVKLEN